MDKRIIRTRNAIRSAFFSLLNSTPIEKISVAALTRCANINRRTFYNYYNTVYDVLDDIETEVLKDFIEIIRGFDLKKFVKSPIQFFIHITGLIEKNAAFLTSLHEARGDAHFFAKAISTLQDALAEVLSKQSQSETWKLKMVSTYIISGMIHVYENWIKTGRKQSIEEISSQLSAMSGQGVLAILQPATSQG